MLKSLKKYAFVYAIALAIVLFALFYSSFHDDISYVNMFRDPIAILDGYPLIGFMSNIGTLAWTIASTVALFCYFFLRKNGYSSPGINFLKWMGLLTLVLLVDDLFLLHEPMNTPLPGIPEEVWYLGYLVGLGLIFYCFRKLIFSQKPVLLFFALFLFGLSIVTDALLSHIYLFEVLEDIFKYFGIVSWSIFLVDFSLSEFQKFVDRTSSIQDS